MLWTTHRTAVEGPPSPSVCLGPEARPADNSSVAGGGPHHRGSASPPWSCCGQLTVRRWRAPGHRRSPGACPEDSFSVAGGGGLATVALPALRDHAVDSSPFVGGGPPRAPSACRASKCLSWAQLPGSWWRAWPPWLCRPSNSCCGQLTGRRWSPATRLKQAPIRVKAALQTPGQAPLRGKWCALTGILVRGALQVVSYSAPVSRGPAQARGI